MSWEIIWILKLLIYLINISFFLNKKFNNIDWIFTYGSFARWDFNKWSDIDLFLILDIETYYHDFLVDNIDWIQITTEILDKSNFYKNIFDNRLAQAKVILDNNYKLIDKQKDLKKNFFNKDNIDYRISTRKLLLNDILSNYDNLWDIEKVLCIFTFIKLYSLIIMDLKSKIPSKKLENKEVLDFLDNEDKIKWLDLIKLWFDNENIEYKYEKISKIIYKISIKVKKSLDIDSNTPFISRVEDRYYNDFLDSTINNNTFIPLITWIEIIISKYCIFHTDNNSLKFSDFTLDVEAIKILKDNVVIKNELSKIEKLLINIDKDLLNKLYFNMSDLINKI